MLGTIVNTAAIIVGSTLGSVLGRGLKAKYQTALFDAMGFAAIAFLAAEFLPLYMILMLHAALLFGCELLCSAAGIGRCAALFSCLRQAVQGLAAAMALVFGIAVLGTALLFMMGGG